MADKKREKNYSLNTGAVEDLVGANEENTPSYSEEELSKYKTKSRFSLNPTLKALLIKFWFSGVVCYFFVWGLGLYIPSSLDLFFVTSIAMGFVVDLLENNIYRFFAKREGENDKWMMFPKSGYMSLVLNVIYAFLVMTCVYYTYSLINIILLSLTGKSDVVLFAMEPLSFGLFATVYDLLFIKTKKTIKEIIKDAKQKVKGGKA